MADTFSRFRTTFIIGIVTFLSYLILAWSGEQGSPQSSPDGGWAAWLQTYGGWGISILLIGLFISFYRDTRNDFQATQQKFESIQRESISSMQAIATNQIFLNTTLQGVTKALENNSHIIQQQGNLLERANAAISRCENRKLYGKE